MIPKLGIRFGEVHYGWLPLEIRVYEEAYSFIASYTPNDFLLELMEALLSVLRGAPRAVATLNEEPTECDFELIARGEAVEFSVIRYAGRQKGTLVGESVLVIEGPRLMMITAFWRGLRELQSRIEPEGFEQQWRRPFPETPMQHLDQQIRDLKEN